MSDNIVGLAWRKTCGPPNCRV